MDHRAEARRRGSERLLECPVRERRSRSQAPRAKTERDGKEISAVFRPSSGLTFRVLRVSLYSEVKENVLMNSNESTKGAVSRRTAVATGLAPLVVERHGLG